MTFTIAIYIASLPIKAVLTYLLPILVMVILGYILTTFFLTLLCKFFLKDYWFEHMIATFGMSTGVFLTGVLLLRICDPDFESPVLANYSLAYTIVSVSYFALLNLFLNVLLGSGIFSALLLSLGTGAAFTVLAILIRYASFKKQ